MESRRVRRLLFVSRWHSLAFGRRVAGVYQRLRLLLDAAAQEADALTIAFFAERDVVENDGAARTAASLLSDWGIRADVHLIPRAGLPPGRLGNLVKPLLRMDRQEEFFRFTTREQSEAVRRLIEADTDLVVAHRLQTAPAVLAAVRGEVPVVLDLDDVEHRKFGRQLRQSPVSLRRIARWSEMPALKRGEVNAIHACRTTLVCSAIDQAYLADLGCAGVEIVPNAMAFPDETRARLATRDTLFFIGSYGYRPNVDGAEFLIRRIFPLIAAIRPQTRLLMVGEAIELLPSAKSPPAGVEMVGFVNDLDAAYARATVVCCPILAGGGTRIKIVEAMARRVPVVSTTIGAEGLGMVDGIDILLRDDAQAFANACIALLDDDERRATQAASAFVKARALYERDAVVARLRTAFRSAAATP